MSGLAATLRLMLTLYVGADLAPVYARHLRLHAAGAEARSEELAEQHKLAAELAQVDVVLLFALAYDESRFDHGRRSSEGALGALQLHPASTWGRAWQRACEGPRPTSGELARDDVRSRRVRGAVGIARCEQLNVLWGAYALRDGFRACGGDVERALGFYRSGRCIAGPRARRTLAVARWVAASLGRVDFNAEAQACLVDHGLERALDQRLLREAEHGGPLRGALDAHPASPLLEIAQMRLGDMEPCGEHIERLLVDPPRLTQQLAKSHRPAAQALKKRDRVHCPLAGLLPRLEDLHGCRLLLPHDLLLGSHAPPPFISASMGPSKLSTRGGSLPRLPRTRCRHHEARRRRARSCSTESNAGLRGRRKAARRGSRESSGPHGGPHPSRASPRREARPGSAGAPCRIASEAAPQSPPD